MAEVSSCLPAVSGEREKRERCARYEIHRSQPGKKRERIMLSIEQVYVYERGRDGHHYDDHDDERGENAMDQ